MRKYIPEEYIPVTVQTINGNDTWYLNIDKIGLEELIKIRKELVGVSEESIYILDSIIYKDIHSKYNKYYEDAYYTRREEKKKERIEIKNKKIKKRKKKFSEVKENKI